MKRQMVAGLASLVLLVAACGSATTDGPAAKQLVAKNVAMVRPAAGVDYGALANGNRALGYALAKKLAVAASDGNMVYSPTSLAIAFAMLREGAVGLAAADIDRVLRLPADRHTSYNALVTALRKPGSGNVLNIGNGLFIDPALAVQPSYLVSLKKWYGAGVFQTPFPAPAQDDINGYVNTNTHGRIPHLIDELDPRAVFALINTVYLNAKWQSPFDKAVTQDAPFTTADRSTVSAHMMHSVGDLGYASGQGWRAVRLPYRGDRLSMWVMLPTGSASPLDLLAPDVLAVADSRFRSASVALSLPRWDIDNKMDLTGTLQQLGLANVFGGAADFRGLTQDPSFVISQVLQQANITVGERGTVAAAATAIIGEVGAPAPPRDQVIFNANHPFAFAIVDNTTGTPLFEGTVSDPS